jgi:hypothetical protein
MSRRLSFLTSLAIFFICPFAIKAQSTSTDTSTAIISIKTYFQNEIREDAHLYSGKEYSKYEPGIKGFPFFKNDEMLNGEILYDGNVYKDVPMLFDIVRQQVVINTYNQETRIQLLTEKIKYFTLNGHRFETVSQAEGKDDNISKGLYDVVYTGKASMLVKRFKKIKKGLRAEDPYTFTEEDEFFIRNGKNLYGISGKNAVMQALDDKKDLVKTCIRKNKLRFKKNIEKDLITVATYY